MKFTKNFILSCGGIENSRILLNFAKKNKSFTNKNIGKNFSEDLCVYPLVSIPKKKFIFKNNLTISPKKNIIKKYNIPNFTLQVLDKSKKLEELFVDGEDIVYYDDMVDCINKINEYSDNEKERERIAKNGYKKVLENHTQKQRVEFIIQKYNEWRNSQSA